MPQPDKGEGEQTFVSRFVGSEEAKHDYPDMEQRLAVAYSLFRERRNGHPVLRQTVFAGLPINVQIEKGQTKSGVDDDGQAWSHTYQFPYGEIAGTEGADGDAVDIYIGSHEDSALVFVIHQLRKDGSHDEDKVFLGFYPQEVEPAYRAHGPEWGWGGGVDQMTLTEFIQGYLASNRKIGARTENDMSEKTNASSDEAWWAASEPGARYDKLRRWGYPEARAEAEAKMPLEQLPAYTRKLLAAENANALHEAWDGQKFTIEPGCGHALDFGPGGTAEARAEFANAHARECGNAGTCPDCGHPTTSHERSGLGNGCTVSACECKKTFENTGETRNAGFPASYFARGAAKGRANQEGLIAVEDEDLTPAGLAAKLKEAQETGGLDDMVAELRRKLGIKNAKPDFDAAAAAFSAHTKSCSTCAPVLTAPAGSAAADAKNLCATGARLLVADLENASNASDKYGSTHCKECGKEYNRTPNNQECPICSKEADGTQELADFPNASESDRVQQVQARKKAAEQAVAQARQSGDSASIVAALKELSAAQREEIAAFGGDLSKLPRENADEGYAWRCQECGHKFGNAAAAERAMAGSGCPKCGGSDFDESLPRGQGQNANGGDDICKSCGKRRALHSDEGKEPGGGACRDFKYSDSSPFKEVDFGNSSTIPREAWEFNPTPFARLEVAQDLGASLYGSSRPKPR